MRAEARELELATFGDAGGGAGHKRARQPAKEETSSSHLILKARAAKWRRSGVLRSSAPTVGVGSAPAEGVERKRRAGRIVVSSDEEESWEAGVQWALADIRRKRRKAKAQVEHARGEGGVVLAVQRPASRARGTCGKRWQRF